MDDESISTTEAIVGQEGSVATLENATPEVEQPKLVPERDLMAVKDKAQRKEAELKARIAELEAQKTMSSDVESLSAKYQWVDADFLADVEKLIDKKAEEKIAPIRNQTQAEKKQKEIDALIDSRLAVAEWIDTSKVDKELLRDLALLPKYRNVDIKDIAEKLYKTEPTGRATTENDTRTAVDIEKKSLDVDNLSKEEIDANWSNPKFRKEFISKRYG